MGEWNVAKFPEISEYIMAYYLDFAQLQSALLTFDFAFGPFESLHKIFVSFEMVQIFRLGDAKIWKGQHCIYLDSSPWISIQKIIC